MAQPKGDLDRIAEFLERVTRDRTEPGTVTVLSVNEPAPRGRYQDYRIEGSLASEGFGPEEIVLEGRVRRDHWPQVGQALPALVYLDRPDRSEILWDRVPKRG